MYIIELREPQLEVGQRWHCPTDGNIVAMLLNRVAKEIASKVAINTNTAGSGVLTLPWQGKQYVDGYFYEITGISEDGKTVFTNSGSCPRDDFIRNIISGRYVLENGSGVGGQGV